MKAAISAVVVLLAFSANSSRAAPAAPATLKPPASPASPGIDPHVVRQLKRVIAAYEKLGSFTVSSFETIETPTTVLHLKSVARLAPDGRMAVKTAPLGGNGQWQPWKRVRVFDGRYFIESVDGRPESRQFLPQWQFEENPLKTFFRGSFGLAFIPRLLHSKSSPNLSSGLETESYRLHPLGGGRMQIECRVEGAKTEGITYGVLYLNIAADGTIERLTARRSMNGQREYQIQTRFSRPTPLRLKNAFDWTNFAPAPNPQGSFYISPQSQAAFKRAARLYGRLRSYATDFEVQTYIEDWNDPFEPDETGKLLWERRGRLRFENSAVEEVIVSDGTSVWEAMFEEYSREPLRESTPSGDVLGLIGVGSPHSADLGAVTGYLVDFLRGSGSLDDLDVYQSYKANLFPAHTLDGVQCDVVVIRSMLLESESKRPNETKVWFARNDGRLLRITQDWGQQKSDVRLRNERFNPFLSPFNWRFVPKKGATDTTGELRMR